MELENVDGMVKYVKIGYILDDIQSNTNRFK